MSTIIERARELRAKIEAGAQIMTNEEALGFMELFPKWNGNGTEYRDGQRVRYGEDLYEVLNNHTSQPDWTPEGAPSLFARILAPEPDVVYDWEQPDSTNGYHVGDKVRFNETVYVSLIDDNVWSPADYPAGWNAVE